MKNRFVPGTGARKRQSRAAFTVFQFVIATFIIVLLTAACALFLQAAGMSMINLSTQSGFNQEAGSGIEFMFSRIRMANTAEADPTGDSLTLGFDDNPDVDSDGDKITCALVYQK